MSMQHQVPVILISGIAEEPMAAATIAMQWDLPAAVTMRHALDVDNDVLWRIISDARGLVERTPIHLDHACVSCAIREDIVPTLERLGADGRWETIIAQLPATAECVQVCRVINWGHRDISRIRIAASVVALADEGLLQDLLGEDSVNERNLPVPYDDDRGVAEVTCAMVEYADVVAISGPVDSTEAADVLAALVRPGVPIVEEFSRIDSPRLARGVHSHGHTESWVAEVRRDKLPDLDLTDAWVLDFTSDRPFHPERLNEAITTLGGGARRSRGCFWLPSRPGQICVWDGAGGHLSIGSTDSWGADTPMTRITVIGLDDGRDDLARTFADCVLTDAEMRERGPYWETFEDGFEPWLGEIRRAA